MRYISDVDFKKQVSSLMLELNKTTDPKEKQKIEDEMNYLKKMRVQSEMDERFHAMQQRERRR